MTQISSIFQQDYSLVSGGARKRPNNPTRRRPGAVRIGNRRMLFVQPVQYTEDELSQTGEAWEQTVASKRRLHECISMEMNEPCPHVE